MQHGNRLSKYFFAKNMSQTVNLTGILELKSENNDIEKLIVSLRKMGNISKSLSECSKISDVCNNDRDETNKNIPVETNDRLKEVGDTEYESEEFDEYKEDENFTTKPDAGLTSSRNGSSRAQNKQVRIPHAKTPPPIPTPIRSKSRSSVRSSNSSVKPHLRVNMSFSNERFKEIERENSILLKKILKAKSDKTTTPDRPIKLKSSNSAVTRKKAQEKIQHDNLIILKKIQRAKSSNLSLRR